MEKENKSRNVSVIKDADGNNVVVINDIIFKGKRSINWDDVENYLKELYILVRRSRLSGVA